LKEWRAVCDALAGGRQSILLRKGGIQEGPGGFAISHDAFALLPTWLHQKRDMLKPAARATAEEGGEEPAAFKLAHGCLVDRVVVVPSRAALDAIDDLHLWAEPYLELRWNYRPERPLFLVLVRAYRLAEPFELENTFEVAGCRSWVPLPATVRLGEPVLDEAVHADVAGRLDAAMSA